MESSLLAAFFIIFSFALRIVQLGNPTNLPTGADS